MALPSPSSWVVFPKPNPRAKLRLFCFPHAGIGASTYRPWASLVGDAVEVCAVQPPGRETRMREAPFRAAEPLVESLLPAIAPLLREPFAFFGHSLGALIAFELCRALRREGLPLPARLIASGRRAPHLPIEDRSLHTMDDPTLIGELRRYNGTPEQLLADAELMALMLPLIRADFAIHETYAHQEGAPLDVPMSAFGGTADPHVSREQLLAWEACSTQPITVRLFPGDHFYLLEDRTVVIDATLSALAPLLASSR